MSGMFIVFWPITSEIFKPPKYWNGFIIHGDTKQLFSLTFCLEINLFCLKRIEIAISSYLRITTRVKGGIEWFEKRFKLTSRRNQRREGSVWLKLNYSSRVASFSFSLKEKQNKVHNWLRLRMKVSPVYICYLRWGNKWKKLTLKHYSNCRRDCW